MYRLRVPCVPAVHQSPRVPNVWEGGRMSNQFDPLEAAAVRRVLWSLAGDDANTDTDTMMDAAEAAVARVESLEERLAEMEELVDPDPGGKAYEQLTKDQKVHRVRTALLEQAGNARNGKAKMNYKEVMWLFDGHPSAGHAYDLMERAGSIDGYAYDAAGGDGEKRVRVDTDAVNDDALFHAVNNDQAQTPA